MRTVVPARAANMGVKTGSLLLALALVAGCATLPPYATDDSMADRTRCLRAGGMWVETQQQYGCRPVERERT